jgi:hypothetical protein
MKCVQAIHLESRGNNVHEDHTKNPSKFQNNKFKGKGNGKKTTTTKKEEGKSSFIHCKKDGHDDEHCWKLHPKLRPNKFGGKGKPKIVSTVQQDLGFDSSDEMKITTVGVQGKVSSHASSSSTILSSEIEKKRSELFHIRVVAKHTKVDTLFDLGSQVNLILEVIVKKLGLETILHPKPYPLCWVCDDEKLQVTRQCRLKFVIASKLVDEVELDVVLLDICGIILGIPYFYDRNAIFF